MNELKLDIGCGKRPMDGWFGLDIVSSDNVKKYDMRVDKLPYTDGTVDAIRCINTLEHIHREYYRHIFNDWWRALKVGGTLEIVVPNFAKDVEHAWGDITHITPWVKLTFRYLTGERPRYADYGFRHWSIIELRDVENEPRDIFALLTPKTTKTGEKYI